MKSKLYLLALVLSLSAGLYAQATATKNFVGTVSAVRSESSEIEAKSDQGEVTVIKIAPETSLKSVAPGETSLTKAVDTTVDTIHPGDRVLVTLQGDLARRVIVMQAKNIEQWKEADRAEWQKRGVAGVVTAKKDSEITLKGHGDQSLVVTVKPNASFKRYPAESVKFADAKPSKLEEVQIGDQLRARGEKAADGLKVTADELVFGTFVTRAGVIQTVNPDTGEIVAKDIGGKETLTVRLTADSQIKKFGFGGGHGGPGGPGAGGARPAGDAANPRAGGPTAEGHGGNGPGGPGGNGPGAGTRRPDISQLIERLPHATKADLKPGETIVFSSSLSFDKTAGKPADKAGKKNDFTAIMLISNAERLLALGASRPGQPARDLAFGGSGGGGAMGLGGLELPTMIP